jgi:hypothetical protein
VLNFVAEIDGDGRLKAEPQFMEWVKQHKGQRVNVRVQAHETRNPSKAMLGYYFNVVVPEFQIIFKEKQGERLTLQRVDVELRKMSPVCHVEVYDEQDQRLDLIRLKEVREMRYSEMMDHIDHCLQQAAMNFGHYIKSPRT